jgi:para-nitrobenzyl esterase
MKIQKRIAFAVLTAVFLIAVSCHDDMIPVAITDTYHPNSTLETLADTSLAARCSNGIFVGKLNDNILTFKGIPYAKPPIGERRWKAPEAPDRDSSVYEAYYFSKAPIQTRDKYITGSQNVTGEDCLYLNIWTNTLDTLTRKPVMVYIHGGSYGWGASMDPLYNGANLVRNNPDIILVTVGYRTGMMGFIDFEGIDGSEDYADSPNLGLLDQVMALKWLNENISAFGGDNQNITIFGESAGGGSVSILSVMPAAKGLFQKAVCESGSIALSYSKDECKPLTEKLIGLTGAKSMSDLIKISETELIALNEQLNGFANFPQRDGRIIPLDLYEAYRRGDAKDIKMITGTNSDETRFWKKNYGPTSIFKVAINVLFENNTAGFADSDKKKIDNFIETTQCEDGWEINEFYNEVMFRLPAICQAEGQADNGGDIYMYYWRYPASMPDYGASHISELSYVFGNLDYTTYTGIGNIDTLLSCRIQNMWVNFARTGTPSDGGFTMPKYNTENRPTTFFNSGKSITAENLPLDTQRQLLSGILKYHLNGNVSSLSVNVPYIWKLAAKIILLVAMHVVMIIGIKRFIQRRRR